MDLPCVLGDFELLERLGQGGMGTVYRARQRSLDRVVALKVMSPGVASDPAQAERFQREARAAAKVQHPNVVAVFDVREVAGQLVMALELVDGGDAQRLAREAGGRLPEARALELLRDCALGLGALADAGLVHRDLKPGNVFVTRDGTAKLGDLGLARTAAGDDRVTKTGSIVGTPAFMAPEQADGSTDLDVRTDVYALGATLFDLLTGRAPFVGATSLVVIAKVLTAPVPDPRELEPGISDATARLVMKCLAKERGQRYQTAKELLEAVERARASQPAPARRAVPAAPAAPAARSGPERPAMSLRSLAVPIAAGAVAGLALLVAIGTAKDPAPAESPPPAPPRLAAVEDEATARHRKLEREEAERAATRQRAEEEHLAEVKARREQEAAEQAKRDEQERSYQERLAREARQKEAALEAELAAVRAEVNGIRAALATCTNMDLRHHGWRLAALSSRLARFSTLWTEVEAAQGEVEAERTRRVEAGLVEARRLADRGRLREALKAMEGVCELDGSRALRDEKESWESMLRVVIKREERDAETARLFEEDANRRRPRR